MSGILPIVSVIVPFKNAEKTLQEAVESLLCQSFSSLEIILVDNASEDGSRAVAERLAASDNRIILVEERQEGVARANNKGMQLAKGEYIARMDADDRAFPDRMEKQLEFLYKHPEIDACGGKVEHWPFIPESRGLQAYVDWSNELLTSEEIYLNRFVELPVINPTLFFRRNILTKVALYQQGDFPEDYEMQLRWMEAGIRFGKVVSPVIQWRDTSGRLTRSDSRYSVEAFFKVKSEYLSRWLLAKNKEEVLVWGAGKKARQRVSFLRNYGIKVCGYIDVDRKKLSAPSDYFFQDLPLKGNEKPMPFILSYVSNRGVRKEIRSFLMERNYKEGADFLLIA